VATSEAGSNPTVLRILLGSQLRRLREERGLTREAAGYTNAPPGEVERRVRLRMDRQRLLTRPDPPPRLWAVVDEAALRRQVGGPDVMRAQLEHLVAMTKLPNVTLQVMPFRFGVHAAEGHAFVILRFAEPDLPDVVYLEQLTSALYLERPEDVDHYAGVMDRLAVQAEEPDVTPEFITRILTET
jgi:hypothetical protein